MKFWGLLKERSLVKFKGCTVFLLVCVWNSQNWFLSHQNVCHTRAYRKDSDSHVGKTAFKQGILSKCLLWKQCAVWCVCVCLCVYVCVSVCLYVCECVCMCVCVSVCVLKWLYISGCWCLAVVWSVCSVHVCAYVCEYVHVYLLGSVFTWVSVSVAMFCMFVCDCNEVFHGLQSLKMHEL